ncbi:MAG: tagaturonate epimerase family protein [Bacteroidetes bacterium]|nr:tagaturonate epimerase family protein [Bacteroidota bacterium]
MIINLLKEKLNAVNVTSNDLFNLEITTDYSITVYPRSINELNKLIYFIGREKHEKFLFILSQSSEGEFSDFQGVVIPSVDSTNGIQVKKCLLSHENAHQIQKRFQFTKPVLLGKSNSFGFGDRLGLANPAHIRSLELSDFRPIIAQQSIRELTRTNRKPSDVMTAAVWAVFQEGYKDGFGSDADHLKTTDDIDLMINNGFTMFTFDPGDHVVNEADTYSIEELENYGDRIPWSSLRDTQDSMLERYEKTNVDLNDGFVISPTREDVLRAMVKYGKAVAHISSMYTHLEKNYAHLKYEIEISVDETESVTTPFEHFFMASELNRLGVKIISLAPRFIGSFEKGIDYIGEIEIFKEEYLKHVKITEHFGSYKISLHSGSDKFDVYAAIGSLKRGYTHVKTAGTSYLEAVKVIATKNVPLFREILDFSRKLFVKEKATYHVSGDINKVHAASEYKDEELLALFESNDARQVLHVTFGAVLTTKKENGEYLFRDKFMDCLEKNEELHYKYLYNHFRRHLKPFEASSKTN